MTATFSTSAMQSFFTFPFKDPRWQAKLAIAAVMGVGGFLIVPMIFFSGYLARIIRRIVDGDGQPALPEWDDWNGLLNDGVRMSAVGLVFNLPLFVLFGIGYFAMMSPAILSPLLEQSNAPIEAYGSLLVLMVVGMVLFFAAMPLSFVVSAFLPVSLVHSVSRQEISAAFRLGEVWRIFRANLGGFLLIYVIAFGLYYVSIFAFQLLSATIILCLPGLIAWFALISYGGIIFNAAFAQAYREGREKITL